MNRLKAIALSLLGLVGAGTLAGCYAQAYPAHGGYDQAYYRGGYAQGRACRWKPARYGHFRRFHPGHWEC